MILGVIFWRMADKTKHRAYNGEANSIWFIGQHKTECELQTQSV